MIEILGKYIVAILGTVVVMLLITIGLMSWRINTLDTRIENQVTQLGVVAAMSTNQEVKIVESKVVEEKLKVVTQDKIKVVKEYIYDTNKTECDNAIDRMRTVL